MSEQVPESELVSYDEPGDDQVPEDSREFTRWALALMSDPDEMNRLRSEATQEFSDTLMNLSNEELLDMAHDKFKLAGREHGHVLRDQERIGRERTLEVLDFAFGWKLIQEWNQRSDK
jgi:hypothetical protein